MTIFHRYSLIIRKNCIIEEENNGKEHSADKITKRNNE